jgi:uncharacterized membrane protein
MRLPLIALAVTFALILGAIPAAHAATLSGTAYTSEMRVATFSLLTINTTPTQQIILANGTYHLNVPPGTYRMSIVHGTTRTTEDDLTVTVTDDGDYQYDFILFPTTATEEDLLDDLEESLTEPAESGASIWRYLLGALIAAIAISTIVWRRKKGNGRKEEKDAEKHDASEKTVVTPLERPEKTDLAQIMNILDEEGGRATQKELRKHIPASEAKISMMLTELEHQGKIERIKSGRANIIVKR